MNEPLDTDKPYKYSTSKARNHSSLDTFAPIPKYVPPWYQRFSIIISLSICLVYFTMMREENDIDEELYKLNPQFEKQVMDAARTKKD